MKFQHYKGGIYTYIGEGIHTETGEKLVIYQNEHGQFWLDPRDMFYEYVTTENGVKERFRKIEVV